MQSVYFDTLKLENSVPVRTKAQRSAAVSCFCCHSCFVAKICISFSRTVILFIILERKKNQLSKSQDFDSCNNVIQKAYSEKVGSHLGIFQH